MCTYRELHKCAHRADRDGVHTTAAATVCTAAAEGELPAAVHIVGPEDVHTDVGVHTLTWPRTSWAQSEGAKRMLNESRDPMLEWESWREVCREFSAAVGDINDKKYNALARAIEAWGEELHALRSCQSVTICDKALQDAVERYRAEATA